MSKALQKRALFFLLAAVATPAAADPVIERNNRVEINWSTMKLRFYGEAQLDQAGASFKSIEDKAWQEGLDYIVKAVKEIREARSEFKQHQAKSYFSEVAARKISRASHSYNTTYYADGKLRVHLESSLAKAFDPGHMRFKYKVPSGKAKNSGLVIQLKGHMSPKPIFSVVSENGKDLYTVSDVAEDSFNSHLMGYWYKKPTAVELTGPIGERPMYVDGKARSDGKIVVSESQWRKALAGNESLLRSARVAIAME